MVRSSWLFFNRSKRELLFGSTVVTEGSIRELEPSEHDHAADFRKIGDDLSLVIASIKDRSLLQYSDQAANFFSNPVALRTVNFRGSKLGLTCDQPIGIDTGAPSRARGDKGATSVRRSMPF